MKREFLLSLLVTGVLALGGCNEESEAGPGKTAANKIDHDITPQMELETAAKANKLAFRAAITDLEKKPHAIGEADADRPQYLLFIKDGCPCSIEAQPLFNRLMEKYAGSVDLVNVTDADPQKAAEYGSKFKVKTPIVSDPKMAAIHGFDAKSAVYSVLVARNGHIVKMWPGYSADMMGDINAKLAQAAGVPLTPFDPQYAPKAKKTGCPF